MNPQPAPIDPLREVRRQMEDHEERLRRLERERATDERIAAIERRQQATEVQLAKLWVICSGASFIASAIASTLAALAVRTLAGG
ncbi:hypothetical protein [Vulgatibacter sp.]|uniref:hypothetical protein n=1 Tax=Vulgatibacter sp. TaxID=1971226 RepID=UPI00356433A1